MERPFDIVPHEAHRHLKAYQDVVRTFHVSSPRSYREAIVDPLYPSTCVYTVSCGDRIKIGITTQFRERMSKFGAQFPYEPVVELIFPYLKSDLRDVEARLHKTVARFRGYGEWFDIGQESMAEIRLHHMQTAIYRYRMLTGFVVPIRSAKMRDLIAKLNGNLDAMNWGIYDWVGVPFPL